MRFGRVALFVAVAALAAACTSDADPGPSKTPSATPSTTVTSSAPTTPSSSARPTPSRTGPLTTGPGVKPGEKPPELPALATKRTAAGAQVFASYYYAAYSWGLLTNDPYLVREIASPDCKECRAYIDAFAALKKAHGVLSGGRVMVRSSKPVTGDFDVRSDYVFRLGLRQERAVATYPDGSTKTLVPANTNTGVYVFVSWREAKWHVLGIGAA